MSTETFIEEIQLVVLQKFSLNFKKIHFFALFGLILPIKFHERTAIEIIVAEKRFTIIKKLTEALATS